MRPGRTANTRNMVSVKKLLVLIRLATLSNLMYSGCKQATHFSGNNLNFALLSFLFKKKKNIPFKNQPDENDMIMLPVRIHRDQDKD